MMMILNRMTPTNGPWRALKGDRRGLAMVEFAMSAPLVIIMITGGAELANYTVTAERMSALAIQVADNASRIGDGDPLAAKKITETQINDLLQGALAQGGNLNINGTYSEKQSNGSVTTKNKARIVISSLEPDPNPLHINKNYIHWQRCYGKGTEYLPNYGRQGDDDLPGMGPTATRVYAPPGTAIMFVEVHYRYEPLFPVFRQGMFGILNYKDMDNVAAMMVRDDRDLSQIYNTEGAAVSSC